MAFEVSINGKKYPIVYNNRKLWDIEEKFDMPIFDVLTSFKDVKKTKDILWIVWVGVSDNISYDDFCEEIKYEEFVENIEIMGEALSDSFLVKGKKEKKK